MALGILKSNVTRNFTKVALGILEVQLDLKLPNFHFWGMRGGGILATLG